MKGNRFKYLLLGVVSFFAASALSGLPGYPAHAQELEALKEITDTPPEDTEFDHYTDDEGIQPYASSLTGQIDNIVVFIRFQGDSEYVTAEGINNAKKIYNTGDLSLKDYLKRISYGNIDINTYFYPKSSSHDMYCSVEVPQNADYYKKQYETGSGKSNGYTTDQERWNREIELLTKAVAGVKDQLASSGLSLDRNRDGKIDGITFVVPVTNPYSENVAHGDLLWAHKSSREIPEAVTIGGEKLHVYTYNLINVGTDNTGILGANGELARTVKHEFLHTLSLPDLYRIKDSSSSPLGPWDIMDMGNAANITAWYQREYLEFGAKLPVYTATTQNITLNTAKYTDPNEVYAIILKSPLNEKEYFVVENRAMEPGCASQLNNGLLVYRIMASGGPDSTAGNAGGPPDFIYAFRPGETSANAGDGKLGYATLSPDNPEGFTSLGKPLGAENPGYDNGVIYYTDGSNSGIVIDHLIEHDDGSMTFDITFPEGLKGSGTESSPYEIYTVSDLYSLSSSQPNTFYRLMNDIDMSGSNFIPISEFKGILDGNGKTIKNLNVSGDKASGFIVDVAANATVKNLTFAEAVVTTSNDYAGIFAAVQGTLDNIAVVGGNITSQAGSISSRAGGLAGVLNDTGVIRNCYTSATVNANHAGGLISYLSGGTIENCYSCGKVNGIGDNAVTGGVLAYWFQQQAATARNVYWDIQNTGQTTNGLILENGSPCTLTGCYGIKIVCPDRIEQGLYIDARILPENGSLIPTGTWETSDPSVADIDADTGTIAGRGKGTATISYKFLVGSYPAVLSADITCIKSDSGDNGDSDNSDNSNGDNDNSDNNNDNNNNGDNDTNHIPELKGSWVVSGGRWWFRNTDGTYPTNGIYSINGSNFAFDSAGWMITGWYRMDNYWYYFNGSGYMHKGWLCLGSTWYYLNPSDGKMYADGIHSIGGSSFAFHGSGAMVVGWYHTGGYWYYFDQGGYMYKGWLRLGNTWYYLKPSDGKMYSDGIHSISSSSFAFAGSGAMITGWYYSDGYWYYFNGSGYMHTGWLRLGSTWYYLNPSDGKMYADGIHAIGNSSFAFTGSGAMVTGWYYSSDGYWYYFNGSGYMHKGWLCLGNTWYYLRPSDGRMYADSIELIDGRHSSFAASGAWLGYTD